MKLAIFAPRPNYSGASWHVRDQRFPCADSESPSAVAVQGPSRYACDGPGRVSVVDSWRSASGRNRPLRTRRASVSDMRPVAPGRKRPLASCFASVSDQLGSQPGQKRTPRATSLRVFSHSGPAEWEKPQSPSMAQPVFSGFSPTVSRQMREPSESRLGSGRQLRDSSHSALPDENRLHSSSCGTGGAVAGDGGAEPGVRLAVPITAAYRAPAMSRSRAAAFTPWLLDWSVWAMPRGRCITTCTDGLI
ncbi:hypothetical protein F7D09_1837 [Bifidobacterium leontopitheci]|uniref:Uncharacterized protein n=1 Tax=Bifidobacterium leontopitheci TaxID=2650774 RepID=A0A6I1GDG2_9BIFI|nr:hypothetical protein F7D09_1837 [Bifidobacterium leontopitheci]